MRCSQLNFKLDIMKRLELNQLNKTQALSLEAKRGSCIVSDATDTPVFEFTIIENDSINCLIVDDSVTQTIIPYHDAIRLKEYLCSTLDEYHATDSDKKLEYVQTIDMSYDECESWCKKNKACTLDGDSGGKIEIQKSYSYSTDENGNKIIGSETPLLFVSMCDEDAETEFAFSVSDKDDIRKLRDYLNNYLEDNL